MSQLPTVSSRPSDPPVCHIEITQQKIDLYADISGDFNPIHVDPDVASESLFGGTIAHGCIPLDPVFRSLQEWLNTECLPPGTKFSLTYRSPSRPGDKITARLKFETADESVAVISFRCHDQGDRTVMEGSCRVPANIRSIPDKVHI